MKNLVIKNFPFYTGIKKESGIGILPGKLDFELTYNYDLNLICQKKNNKIDFFNEIAYKQGSSLSTPLGKGSFGGRLADDILNSIKKVLPEQTFKGLKVLEIGCGDGYLLKLIKDQGADYCIGFEPNPIVKSISGSDFIIINDFFDVEKIREDLPAFDLIFTHGVLEHISEPVHFLKGIKKFLSESGIIFNAVPNCEFSLRKGDIGILSHEHYNYFTSLSLKRTYNLAGYSDCFTSESGYGWTLYSYSKKSGIGKSPLFSGDHNKSDLDLYNNYIEKAEKSIDKIQSKINFIQAEKKTIGIFGGSPYMFLFEWKPLPRIFDTDIEKHGKFIPGVDKAIEPPDNLKKSAVDYIIIAPVNYDSDIREFLSGKMGFPLQNIISPLDFSH